MSVHDPLEGFREPVAPGDFTDDEQRLQEILVNRNHLLRLIDAGQKFAAFLDTPPGQQLWDEQSAMLGQSIQHWLSSPDPASEASRLAHFNARVAVSVLQQFQRAIDSGREASANLRRSEEDEQIE